MPWREATDLGPRGVHGVPVHTVQCLGVAEDDFLYYSIGNPELGESPLGRGFTFWWFLKQIQDATTRKGSCHLSSEAEGLHWGRPNRFFLVDIPPSLSQPESGDVLQRHFILVLMYDCMTWFAFPQPKHPPYSADSRFT